MLNVPIELFNDTDTLALYICISSLDSSTEINVDKLINDFTNQFNVTKDRAVESLHWLIVNDIITKG